MINKTNELEKELDYFFEDKKLLELALTHSSFSRDNNERLEFLGDAVLELITTQFLFNEYDDQREGELTKLRSKMVCESNLANIAKKINLGNFLNLSNGEEKGNGREKNSILSDAVEAIIGAIFLDSDFYKTKEVVLKLIKENTDIKNFCLDDPKSKLQEIIQNFSNKPLIYKTIKESGPDHDKIYTVQIIHNKEILSEGMGKSKKEAEQMAAFKYLKDFKMI
jgi:ribonuclease-3